MRNHRWTLQPTREAHLSCDWAYSSIVWCVVYRNILGNGVRGSHRWETWWEHLWTKCPIIPWMTCRIGNNSAGVVPLVLRSSFGAKHRIYQQSRVHQHTCHLLESSLRPAAISFVGVSTLFSRKSGQQKTTIMWFWQIWSKPHSAVVWNVIQMTSNSERICLKTTQRTTVWNTDVWNKLSVWTLTFFIVSPAYVGAMSLP